MIKYITLFLVAITAIVLSTSCKESSGADTPTIFTLSSSSLAYTATGGSSALTIKMNGSSWTATSDQTWCTVSASSSSQASTQLTVTVAANTTSSVRTAKLTFVMDSKTTVYVSVSQAASTGLYPSYKDSIAPDATGVSSTAKVLAAKMFAGWNLGNSLEVPSSETAWGNPKTAQILIDSIKAAGINAIRIPCAWNSYIEDTTTCKIKASWLARVKEVVDYCYKNDMYVILNIHWDGGWLENNPTYAKQVAVNAKQKALWEQIAVYFRAYDEHLLFAGTNEVHADYNTPTTENLTVQMSYNQTFVNAVRSTGGKNAYRNLIIQSYNTNISYAGSYLKVSTDAVSNKLMVEVHYYDPYDFTLNTTNTIYLWGASYAQYGSISTWGQEDYVQSQFQSMKTNFVDKGYPVILGEFGAIRRLTLTGTALTNHLASRAYFTQYVAQQAKNYGLVPFVWDNGTTGDTGMGIFNRTTGAISDRQELKAYIAGASAGVYPY
jgi:endoglucanase